MVRRENSFRIDYSSVPKKPTYDELHHFVGTVLGLKQEDLIRIQCSRNLGCAFVKVNDLTVAQRVVAEHDDKHTTEVDGKVYKIRIVMEDGAVEVKLYDLSEDVTDAAITEYLSRYGDVLSIHELMWSDKYLFAGISTGVRVVRMMVRENIPSLVTIDGETTCVSYFGQQQTCRHCSEIVHNGITCVQNKKLLFQKSYANVTKQAVQKPMRPKSGPKVAAARPRTASYPALKPPGSNQPSPKPTTSKAPVEIMPPPASATVPRQRRLSETVDPPKSHSALSADSHQPSLTSGMDARNLVPGGKGNGNETDESTASATSKRSRGRPPGKKPRTDLSDDSNDEDYRP